MPLLAQTASPGIETAIAFVFVGLAVVHGLKFWARLTHRGRRRFRDFNGCSLDGGPSEGGGGRFHDCGHSFDASGIDAGDCGGGDVGGDGGGGD